MIIDCHGHVSAPAELWVYKSLLLSHRGEHGKRFPELTDEQILSYTNKKEMAPCGHLDMLDKAGTDYQLLSPRPFQMMHSEKPGFLVHWFTEATNNIIARQCQLMPERFAPICGLPQVAGEPVENVLSELERCVTTLDFKGCLLNPDPYENSGTEPPAMGDRYWYPLYEKLCELDVPAHIHSAGSRSVRTPYTLNFLLDETVAVYGLIHSDVFKDFPTLKIVCSHGGGAIPFHVGRFHASALRRGGDFYAEMRNIYYDTVLYSEEALRLLIKTVGADNCLFGAECPGVGSAVDPNTGKTLDDIAPFILGFDWLSQADKDKIMFGNAMKLFKLDPPPAATGA
jgi:OH-DDVA meta-cleavage compound hydrolase